MSLPAHIDPARLQRDPGGRVNHVWYPATDEVFHVDEAIYAAVLAADPLPLSALVATATETTVPTDLAAMKFAELKKLAAERGLTVKVGISTAELVNLIEQDLNREEQEQTLTRDELLRMAEDLELTIPEGASDEEIEAIVRGAIEANA